MTVQLLFTQAWVEHLGWTLLHFLWQGALISVLFAFIRRLLGRSLSANARYVLACLTLAVMVAAPLVTLGLTASLGPTQRADRLSLSPTGASVPPALPWLLPSANAWQRTLPWIVRAWLIGVSAFSIRLFGGWILAARLRSSANRAAPGEWQQVLDKLIGRIGISRPVSLLISSMVEVPTVIGWLRPVVLVPVGALAGLPPQHLEALLAHELAHIWRHDYLINLLQSIAEAVLFYHPAVWWVSGQIRAERERCCDDLAVAASGDVLTYARALADLESCRPAHNTAALAANGGSLLNRIHRLLDQPVSHAAPNPGAAWALSILLLVGVGAAAVRGAQEPASPSKVAQEPVVETAAIWTDTVKQGDLALRVRALGTLITSTTAELKIGLLSQVQFVQPGQAVSIDLRESSGIRSGKVTKVRPGVINGAVTVEVLVEPPPPAVPPGTAIDGTIEIGRLSNVIYVGRPVSGQPDSEGTLFKLDPDGKQAVRVKVQYGRTSVNTIQIRSGLAPGDRAILSDMSAFKDYDRIILK